MYLALRIVAAGWYDYIASGHAVLSTQRISTVHAPSQVSLVQKVLGRVQVKFWRRCTGAKNSGGAGHGNRGIQIN